MNINIVCVGKIKEKFIKDGIDEYAKRLSRFCKFQITEVSEELCSDPSPKNIELTKIAEGERIIAKLKGYSIALDLNGKSLTSEGLSKKISLLKQSGTSTLSFVIGGSYGLSKEVLDKCDYSLCFGAITFPHQLIRLVLSEQIYRAFMIEEGSAYHK
ncbi:MAG: 23S rRNA (pseudouridine(1915)-N(3))-methyltransferase RlmH [Clostridia bacterium]|nr:23S rRNA (pseudouridine(1915)-N(3))-methyltransferase RlmH [Clostridia bacterium]MDE7328437.1 23S rRNA (pseudouridine(1915)-N(3))-methyltransferase RlmH [Clostridia bacterium]